jgi:hypothetical protein
MITFVTCWYILKAKFDVNTYLQWITNFLTNCENFKLIIFTNQNSYEMINHLTKNPNIHVIFKEIEDFSTYHLKDNWINNHKNNPLLNKSIQWELNMLWNEKINFVKEAIDKNIFDTEFYGWCDIGYFRCRKNIDISKELVKKWPNKDKINQLNKDKIYYCRVCFTHILSFYARIILNKGINNLPKKQIPPNQVSIAGGFFLMHKKNIDWYHETYYNLLKCYFNNNYLIKDDQILVLDTIISNLKKFALIEQKDGYDRWFGFQTYLL